MRQEMIERMSTAIHAHVWVGADSGETYLANKVSYDGFAEAALDALLDALEAKQPILEAYELIEVLRGES